MKTSNERIKPVSRIVRWGIPILLILIPLSLLSYCTFLLPSHYEQHGISEYSYSSLEIDCFDYMPPYRDDFDCVDCDYYYKYDEKGLMNNILDRGLYYFVYTEEGYPAAKAYCLQRCREIGTEPTEEYNGLKAKAAKALFKTISKSVEKDSDIKWNFTKFLISKDGETIKRYAPTTEPKDFEKDVEAML